MKTVVYLVLCNLWVISGLLIEEFVPFGVDNGDTVMDTMDDYHEMVILHSKMSFWGRKHQRLWIHNNGVISLRTSLLLSPYYRSTDTPKIMPFWSDIETFEDDSGKVFYRQTLSRSVLETLENEIQQANPMMTNLRLSHALVVTWFNVSYDGVEECLSDRSRDFWPRNTFQAILTTDGVRSFAIFNYNKIMWTAQMNGNCLGIGAPAMAGFDVGNYKNLKLLSELCRKELLALVKKSNVGVPGKFIYRIDEITIDTTTEFDDA